MSISIRRTDEIIATKIPTEGKFARAEVVSHLFNGPSGMSHFHPIYVFMNIEICMRVKVV